MASHNVGILIFSDVEVLDFCGPFEVFSVTRLNPERRREESSPFRLHLVGLTTDQVTTSGGMRVVPDCDLESCPPLDLLVIPGGIGTRPLLQDQRLLTWIQERAQQVSWLTSVCTGSLLLGKAGLLDGKRATTHWAALDLLAQIAPNTEVVRDEHVVTMGNLVTSAGISAGIDMALGMVARLHGETVARATAQYMEYRYCEDNRRRM